MAGSSPLLGLSRKLRARPACHGGLWLGNFHAGEVEDLWREKCEKWGR